MKNTSSLGRIVCAPLLLVALCCITGISPKPQGTEVQFVQQIQADLMSRFPSAQDAMNAGYFRYTPEDDTGAISYVNLQWTSADPQHPSQLWYDVHGNLLGADFSQPYTSKPPNLWGVDPPRWHHFHQHIHWVVNINGKESYGEAHFQKNPDAAMVVKLKGAHNVEQVTHVFVFPSIWDITVWVKPNPNGAFADANPLVKPSKNAEKG